MAESKLIYLSLGSNLGDRAANIARAIEALRDAGIEVLRESSLYETAPLDYTQQPWFLNCVLEVTTDLLPRQLLHKLDQITRELGPPKRFPKGPRVIDLDILLYGESVIKTAELEVPHPRMAQRRFVLVPLAELAPELRHPVLRVSVANMLATTKDRSEVHKWAGEGEYEANDNP